MKVGNKFFLQKNEQKRKDGIISCWFILKNTTHEMLIEYFKLYFIFPSYKLYISIASKPFIILN